MKKVLIIIIFFVNSVYAFDTICKTDGEEIFCKIVDEESTQITYKRSNDFSDSLYSIVKDSVLFVKYKDGEKIIFKNSKKPSSLSNNYGTYQTYNYYETKKKRKRGFSFIFGLGPCEINNIDCDAAMSSKLGVHVYFPLNSALALKTGYVLSSYYLINDSTRYFVMKEMMYFAYSDIPFLLNFGFNLGKDTRMYFDIGPRVSILTLKGTASTYYVSGIDISNSLKTYTVGLIFNAGLEFGYFLLEGGIEKGFTNLFDTDKLEANKNYTTTTFWFTAGVKF